MPKIIPNIREQLLTEAKKQISEQGYGKTTIRSVANACNLGVGTVYNYFNSKDMLIATFMAEDWAHCLARLEHPSSYEPKSILKGIYDVLVEFTSRYGTIFSDRDAAKTFAATFAERHKMLRDQLVDKILPIFRESDVEDKEFLAQHIAESLLTWTVAGVSFEKQYSIVSKIIK